jgi:hypothetical protein
MRDYGVWLAALVAVGCGGGTGDGETCREVEVAYAGAAKGALLVKERGMSGSGLSYAPDSGRGLASAALNRPGGSSACSKGGPALDEIFEVTAWIDLAGDEREACGIGAGPTLERVDDPGCAPDAEDPVGRTSGLVKRGEYNILRVTISDP